MKVVSFPFLSPLLFFSSRAVSPINNSSKALVNLTKFASGHQHTSPQLNFLEQKKRIFRKGLSYIMRKIRRIVFLLFDVKELLTSGKKVPR